MLVEVKFMKKNHPKGKNHPLYKRVHVNCATCGQELLRHPMRIRANKRHFCNQKCYGKFRSVYYRGKNNPSYGKPKRGKYNPAWKGGKVTVECKLCAKEFETWPYRIRDGASFCSHDCYGKWLIEKYTGENNPLWKGGHEYYRGPNWCNQRKKARRRDKYTCQICGMKENGRHHEVHHIIPFNEFDLERYREANRLENLIMLCRSCHMQLEHQQQETPAKSNEQQIGEYPANPVLQPL